MSVIRLEIECSPGDQLVTVNYPSNLNISELTRRNDIFSTPIIFKAVGCLKCPRLISRSRTGGWYDSKPPGMSDEVFLSLIIKGAFINAYYPEIAHRDEENHQIKLKCPLLDQYMIEPKVRGEPLPCQNQSGVLKT